MIMRIDSLRSKGKRRKNIQKTIAITQVRSYGSLGAFSLLLMHSGLCNKNSTDWVAYTEEKTYILQFWGPEG